MSKPIRIFTAMFASLAIGGMFAYQDAQKNALTYQQHPVTVVLTDFFCGFLSGLIFYFGSGWLARRKERKLEKAGDVKYYEEVARELQEKPMVPGLWTKAFTEANGEEAKARAFYIKYRIAQLAEASRQRLQADQLVKWQQKKTNHAQNIKAMLPKAFVLVVAVMLVLGFFANKTQKPSEHESYDFIGLQKKLAEGGDANAATSLGVHYERGIDVQVDKAEAYKWYSIAVALGSETAKKYLTQIEGQMTPDQIAKAKQLSAALIPRKNDVAQPP